MEIRNVNLQSNFLPSNNNFVQKNSPNFKGAAFATNLAGGFMQWIEEGGFLLSFLIQDFLGMTLPRTYAGFLRDREVTGKINSNEGFEVLGREGLSGPVMMAAAPLTFWATAKCGKTTGVNSQLIKRFGNSLKEIVSSNNFDKSVLKNKAKFKEEFFRRNVEAILEQNLGRENVNDESIKFIMERIKNYESIPEGTKLKRFRGKAKYRKQCVSEISDYIDSIRYKNSSDLDLLQKVKFGSDKLKDYKVFDTRRTIEALVKYSDDAITANKHLEKLDSALAESIKHKAIGKRLLANIAAVFATIGFLSVLPKIYARSSVAPGARKNIEQNESDISFKGKGEAPKGILEKIGKAIEKKQGDFASSELEYNGYNFTNTLMSGLALFGLITPRVLRANKRAQKDENGKKDYTEVWEILVRDITSTLTVIFAVPMLTRAFVTSFENKTGFVLMQKNRNMSKWKTFLDLLNPYSKAHVLTNSEIASLYGNIDSKEKMLNFAKYIDKNGGDLEKIISKSEKTSDLFNEKTLELDKLRNKTKSEKNKEIISFIEKIEEQVKKINNRKDKKSVDKIVKDLMIGIKPEKNPITKYARGWNSIPAAVATIFVTPYLLGWIIPRFTYKNTRRIHDKEDKAKKISQQV